MSDPKQPFDQTEKNSQIIGEMSKNLFTFPEGEDNRDSLLEDVADDNVNQPAQENQGSDNNDSK